MRAILVVTTVKDVREARRLARFLVQKKLAACVSIQKQVESHYRWKGNLEKSKEALIFIKAPEKNYSLIEKTIKHLHSYSLPEILAIPVKKAYGKYLQWINDSCE